MIYIITYQKPGGERGTFQMVAMNANEAERSFKLVMPSYYAVVEVRKA